MNMFKMPHVILDDVRLSKSARLIAAVLCACHGPSGRCCRSYAQLAAAAGLRSEKTARRAVAQLLECGYVSVRASRFRSAGTGRVLRGANVYRIDRAALLKRGYTFLPRRLLRERLSASEKLLCIAVYRAAGNERRAFPSISRLCRAVSCARSTVCAALRVLRSLPFLLVRLCRKKSGAFAASSYHLVHAYLWERDSETIRPTANAATKPNLTLHCRARKVKSFFHLVRVRSAISAAPWADASASSDGSKAAGCPALFLPPARPPPRF